MKNTNCDNCYICSRKQKFWALVLLFGIFGCGLMTGLSPVGHKIVNTADSGVKTESKGLVGTVQEVINPEPLEPCQINEKVLKGRLVQDIDDNATEWAIDAHQKNFMIYERLVNMGCRENRGYFSDMAENEMAYIKAITGIDKKSNEVSDVEKPCREIENALNRRVISDCTNYGVVSECHLNNAEVYSKLAEDGCAENAEQYRKNALDELQIADGVRINASDVNPREVRSTINTYKKLQMQNEARRYLNKVERMLDPGIDFIMELQKVIEE
ncbi:MAG: hypothetical protein J6Y07_00110 [Alphaproteobacteria bacterium]|nr:hypothetical protein [Alphaproteobacteria bacterium]